ncbi:hypothetical protein SAMN05216574_10846 [Blastococcus tunisiensis]|uniref:Uncharacterized protein n=1 Tax=Blastococcus tunisiensis TaxID=1798228 RepID=A0A1I2FBL9_9ACTN|nr:hypothetical protein SAMN05216574_10846 [Blastococcus sp. DSM 46838]
MQGYLRHRFHVAGAEPDRQAAGMTEPREDDETNNLHPGQHDEGGHGGMATRERDAEKADDQPGDRPRG